MKTSTMNLEKDHENILSLIQTMEKVQLERDPDIKHLELIIDLIRNYADGFHHSKEEKVLFPFLAERGFSLSNGPLAVMLNEHTLGREYVKNMEYNILLYKEGDKNCLSAIYSNMQSYTDLLRNHIDKENNILFRMADRVLSEQEQQQLLIHFQKVEKSAICGKMITDYITAIEHLSRAYNVKQTINNY